MSLLKGNAEQIMGIVRPAHNSINFDENTQNVSCQGVQSDSENLHDRWSIAVDCFQEVSGLERVENVYSVRAIHCKPFHAPKPH